MEEPKPPRPKHNGCFDCGSMRDQVLTSIPTPAKVSKAICKECLTKPANAAQLKDA